MDNYLKSIPVTPSYLEHWVRKQTAVIVWPSCQHDAADRQYTDERNL